jgi:hypothetical protein
MNFRTKDERKPLVQSFYQEVLEMLQERGH